MAEAVENDVWDRQFGEPRNQFVAFAFYRDLGPTRTYADAVRIYLTPGPAGIPLPGKARKRQERSQAAFEAHPRPERFINNMASTWLKRWSRKWDWVGRACHPPEC